MAKLFVLSRHRARDQKTYSELVFLIMQVYNTSLISFPVNLMFWLTLAYFQWFHLLQSVYESTDISIFVFGCGASNSRERGPLISVILQTKLFRVSLSCGENCSRLKQFIGANNSKATGTSHPNPLFSEPRMTRALQSFCYKVTETTACCGEIGNP